MRAGADGIPESVFGKFMKKMEDRSARNYHRQSSYKIKGTNVEFSDKLKIHDCPRIIKELELIKKKAKLELRSEKATIKTVERDWKEYKESWFGKKPKIKPDDVRASIEHLTRLTYSIENAIIDLRLVMSQASAPLED